MEDFWLSMDRLVASSLIVIDRAQGTAHPRYADMIYPLDYGYLEGTNAGDGEGIDVWVGCGHDRGHVVGIICTADSIKRDAEIKILLGCSPQEVQIVLQFLQANLIRCLLVERGK